ncbi:MAG: dNTP triphosphohydrolase [Bacilli bacterium]|nr:dNTP triphosphohydrolase [Bacilli bacterium]
MEWKYLLSTARVPNPSTDLDLNKEFSYLISSSAIRRLQDKAQVFPLEQGDFVRTRLTHSLEAMSVADEIGKTVTLVLNRRDLDERMKKDPKDYIGHFKFRDEISKLSNVLKTAALIHDIGNPPFGHIGESIISEWFKENLDKFYIKKTITSVRKSDKEIKGYYPIIKFLNEQEKQDLYNFDGNAQLLRILSKLNINQNCNGYTATLYSTCMKYTLNSIDYLANKDSGRVEYHKIGHFETEDNMVSLVQNLTKTGTSRNPLAFLLEASDDISYLTADIEDAIKKGIIDIDDLINKLSYLKNSKEVLKSPYVVYYENLSRDLDDLCKKNKDKERKIIALRIYLRKVFIDESCLVFETNYSQIMSGVFISDLLSQSKAVFIAKKLRQFLNNEVYRFKDIAIQKAKVYKILNVLLDEIVPAAFSCSKTNSVKTDNKIDIVCELISPNYRKLCNDTIYKIKNDATLTKERSLGLQIYNCLRLAVDQISGMTDLYASSLYEILDASK